MYIKSYSKKKDFLIERNILSQHDMLMLVSTVR